MISANLVDLLKRLEQCGIRLSPENGQLRFNAPPGAMTPELRSQLTARKVEIIEFLEQAAASQADASRPIPPLSPGQSRLLSFSQEQLWFLDQLDGPSAVYNIYEAWRIRGELNVSALEQALIALIGRHEILRTFVRVSSPGGSPEQIIGPAPFHFLNVIDLSGQPPDAREGSVAQIVEEEARRPFDLTAGPLFRGTVVRLHSAEHVFVATLHHIAFDAESFRIMHRELACLYTEAAAGQPLSPAPTRIQFADFAAWQRDRLKGDDTARHVDYWKSRLAGAPPVLNLPADHLRLSRSNSPGRVRQRRVSPSTSAAFNSLGRETGATPFIALLAALQTLLHRYSGQNDVLVGFPVSNRSRVEVASVIGFFVNLVVLRTDLSGDPTARELIRRVRQSMLDDLPHHELPFERLVQELHPGRRHSRTPLVQVVLAYQPAEPLPEWPAGLDWEIIPVHSATAKFDLTVNVSETSTGLDLAVEYATDLFADATMEGLLVHFECLLERFIAQPDEPISRLDLLSPVERDRIVTEWNQTNSPYPQDRGIVELIADRVAENPTGLAVSSGSDRLTYAELAGSSDRLAGHLLDLGLPPEGRVGVLAGRSAPLIIAQLAAMKAGAAYLPMDPAYPAERLQFILRDAGVDVLLATDESLDSLRESMLASAVPRLRVIRIRHDHNLPSTSTPQFRQVPFDPSRLAYVIYTSGSTGRPKGVQIEHHGLSNLVGWHNRAYGVSPADRATLVASPAFDASVWEIWPYLAAGASVHIPAEEIRSDPCQLVRWLCEQRITITFLPTPLAESALSEVWPEHPKLRFVLTGGDRLSRRPDKAHHFQLINHYGPTENTVVTTAGRVEFGIADHRAPSIGRPINNVRTYILDRGRQPVPPGVVGELFVGGASLARGYLGHPDLTREKFVPDPFDGQSGARLYRTGDLARYDADGSIHFIGRTDHQVKIRGYRIELAEIESVLRDAPGVEECVVVARDDRHGERFLAAFVVPVDPPGFSPEMLRKFLRQHLPDHMIPAAWCALDRLPMSANGKIDSAALPDPWPVGAVVGQDAAGVAPSTTLEEELAAIWEELLGRRGIGIRDNFFDLGGHSLLAVRMLGVIEQRLGLKAGLSALYGQPTIEHLSTLLLQEQHRRELPDRSLHPDGHRTPFLFFHGDFTGGGFFCQRLAQEIGPDRPFYGIHPHGLFGDAIPPTIEDMAGLRIELIRRIQPVGPYLLGGYCNGGLVALEVARQLAAGGETVAALVLHQSAMRVWNRRWVQVLAQGVSRIAGDDSAGRLHRSLRWQERVDFCHDLVTDHFKALRKVRGEQGGLGKFLREKLSRLKRRLGAHSPEPAAAVPTTPDAPALEMSPADRTYYDAVIGYVPKPYSGRFTLCWPAENVAALEPDGRAGWTRVRRDVQLILVPGGHQTSVSNATNVVELGGQIRKILDEACPAPMCSQTHTGRGLTIRSG